MEATEQNTNLGRDSPNYKGVIARTGVEAGKMYRFGQRDVEVREEA